MKNIRYNAARGSVGVICPASGLVEANYSGPLCIKAFDALRSDMMAITNSAPASVVRLDRSLILASDLPELPPGALDPTPACLIVRRDQYDLFQSYASKLARQGAIRLVFVESHAALAYEWALKRCAARPAQ